MASESASPSTATGIGSTSAPTIREIISTNRNPQIWKDFNFCIMTDNSQKAQCKHCFHFLSQGSNTTLRNHITHSHCEVIKAQKNQNPKAGQMSMARDGSVFRYDPDYLRKQFAGLVIQRALPFNHFDHGQTTRVFQNTMQPRYTHLTTSSPPSSPDQTKEYITEFDSSQITQHESKNHLISTNIIPNQWKPLVSNVEKQDPNVTNNVFDIIDNTNAKNINHAEEKPMSWIERLKLRKLKDDGLEKVHDDGVEEFDLSVDEFVNAYMKRYGWCEGKGVRKNAARDEKDVEYKKGNDTRVGLGFVEDNGGEFR
nr:protein MOS2-like [Tanacetum cinerariifolium]